MTWKIKYSDVALENLDALPLKTVERIVAKIESYRESDQPMKFAKALQGKHGFSRFRIGDYRAIFEVTPEGIISIIHIIKVAHRKDIYE